MVKWPSFKFLGLYNISETGEAISNLVFRLMVVSTICVTNHSERMYSGSRDLFILWKICDSISETVQDTCSIATEDFIIYLFMVLNSLWGANAPLINYWLSDCTGRLIRNHMWRGTISDLEGYFISFQISNKGPDGHWYAAKTHIKYNTVRKNKHKDKNKIILQ